MEDIVKIVEDAQKPPEGTAAWDTDEFLDGAIHENYGASGGFDEWVLLPVLCIYIKIFNHLYSLHYRF